MLANVLALFSHIWRSSKALRFLKCIGWVYLLRPGKWSHHLLCSRKEKEIQTVWVFLRGFPGSDVVGEFFISNLENVRAKQSEPCFLGNERLTVYPKVNKYIFQQKFVEVLLCGGVPGRHGKYSLYRFPSHNTCRGSFPSFSGSLLLTTPITSKSWTGYDIEQSQMPKKQMP